MLKSIETSKTQRELSAELKNKARQEGFNPVGIARVPASSRIQLRNESLEKWLDAGFQADMGWMAFKPGVCEKLSYPWFEQDTKQPTGLFTDTLPFCKKLREAGHKIMVDGNTKLRFS